MQLLFMGNNGDFSNKMWKPEFVSSPLLNHVLSKICFASVGRGKMHHLKSGLFHFQGGGMKIIISNRDTLQNGTLHHRGELRPSQKLF